MVDIKQVLERINERLDVVRLSEKAAGEAAGSRDAIRNIRRAVQDNTGGGCSLRTLIRLAPVLQVTVADLVAESGEHFGDLSEMEQRLIERFRNAAPERRQSIEILLNEPIRIERRPAMPKTSKSRRRARG